MELVRSRVSVSGLHEAIHFPIRYVPTSSSAVAKRPCDASCLSVVSFNSTKRRVESFIVSYIRRLQTDLSLRAVKCAVLLSLA